jgi:hypothetical protein
MVPEIVMFNLLCPALTVGAAMSEAIIAILDLAYIGRGEMVLGILMRVSNIL